MIYFIFWTNISRKLTRCSTLVPSNDSALPYSHCFCVTHIGLSPRQLLRLRSAFSSEAQLANRQSSSYKVKPPGHIL
jgi:hypothetical protein